MAETCRLLAQVSRQRYNEPLCRRSFLYSHGRQDQQATFVCFLPSNKARQRHENTQLRGQVSASKTLLALPLCMQQALGI